MKISPVVHFEMPYRDKKRLAKFYSRVLGWEMQMTGEEFGNYVLATTSPVDKKGMHRKKGAINGGFYPKGDYGTIPHVVVAVGKLEEQMKMVKKAGGKVRGKPMDIPGIGRFVMITDTEGNRVGMLQPKR